MKEKREKKPFGQTKIVGFLKKVALEGAKRLPIGGGIVESILKPEGGKGKLVFDQDLAISVVVGVLILTILESTGVLNTGVTQFFIDMLHAVFGGNSNGI